MLTHNIVKYQPKKEEKKSESVRERIGYQGILGSLEHKRFIHARVLSNCKFEEGEHVKYDGMVALITEILGPDQFNKVDWNDLECKCVEIFLYDLNEFELCHPNQLKRYQHVSGLHKA